MGKINFKEWYKKKYDPNGFLYPSAPMKNISFMEMCERVDEYNNIENNLRLEVLNALDSLYRKKVLKFSKKTL